MFVICKLKYMVAFDDKLVGWTVIWVRVLSSQDNSTVFFFEEGGVNLDQAMRAQEAQSGQCWNKHAHPLNIWMPLYTWGFPKIRGTLLGVPIIRIIVHWGRYWGN